MVGPTFASGSPGPGRQCRLNKCLLNESIRNKNINHITSNTCLCYLNLQIVVAGF